MGVEGGEREMPRDEEIKNGILVGVGGMREGAVRGGKGGRNAERGAQGEGTKKRGRVLR